MPRRWPWGAQRVADERATRADRDAGASDVTRGQPLAIDRLNDLLIVAPFKEWLRTLHLDSLDALFAVPGEASLHKPGLGGWRERVRIEPTECSASDPRGEVGLTRPATLYLKRFSNPPAQGRRLVRDARNGARSVAEVEWNWLHCCWREGLPCPMPVAMGSEFRGGRERRSALLMSAVAGQSLERGLAAAHAPDRPTLRTLLDATADLVKRFHRGGLVHRDLYCSHVFYDRDAGGNLSLRLIDFQRVLRPVRGRARWIVKDLASLHYSAPAGVVTRTDRLRWLKRYLGLPKLDAPAKVLAWQVVGKTARIARHDRRRMARLRAAGEGTA